MEARNTDGSSYPLELKNCWLKLKQVKKGDKEYRKAKRIAKKLEHCRLQTKKAFDKGLREVMEGQREMEVQRLDTFFLEIGMDVKIKLSGKHKERIILTNVLFNRVWMHHNQQEVHVLVKGCEKIGFERVTFSDGFGLKQYFDLEPQNEARGGQTVLGGMGIGTPFQL